MVKHEFSENWWCIRHEKHITKEMWDNHLCDICYHKKKVAIGLR